MTDEYLLWEARRKDNLAEVLELAAESGNAIDKQSRLNEAKRLRQEAKNLRAEWKFRQRP